MSSQTRQGHFSSFLGIAIFLAVVALLSGQFVMGQAGVDATIVGFVKDSTGAVVPGVDITATNLDTGLIKTVVSDGEGNFVIPALPNGSYSVEAKLPGFKTWDLQRIDLLAGQQARIEPLLEVGEIDTRVTVEGVGTFIQTEEASVESSITTQQILELPLAGRNPVELVKLVPGMRYLGQQGGTERAHNVQGMGNRTANSEFAVDGLTANTGMDEGGIGIPNVDTIAEFKIQTANFSAEYGRNPLQIKIITKSGTNQFHGSAWWFYRTDALDARNAFATSKPELTRNQFGGSVGGPIIQDRTFFFASYEGVRIDQERIYNSFTIAPAMLDGDFTSIGTQIVDPETGDPFPGNIIPQDRIVDSARFFFDAILLPNSPDQRFKAVAPLPDDKNEFTIRLDQRIGDSHVIYARYIYAKYDRSSIPQYRPEIIQGNATKHDNFGINYNWTITPTTLLELGANVLVSDNNFTSPQTGQRNLTQEAGIQGFSTEGRAAFVGLPNVSFSGYTGMSMPWGTPGRLWMNAGSGRANFSLIRGDHSMNIGYDYSTRSTWGRHGSCCSRGVFGFNGQYTGDGFADYLLGLVASSSRNFPLQTFGMAKSPFSSVYFQDDWRVNNNVTLNLGLRYDYWHEKTPVRGNTATFDVERGTIVAGTLPDGSIDLNAQPVAPFLSEATKDMWVPAQDVGAPPGLFEANGYLSPRLGIAWRPGGGGDFVIRGGFGIFASSFRGNASASAIVGPPYWSFETTGWSASEMQRWETAWPEDPTAFVTPSVQAPDWKVKTQKAYEWNISIQKSLVRDMALTVSYVGNKMTDLITNQHHNEVPAGQYDDLQGSKPFPSIGSILIYENIGSSWFNALQLKLQKRFSEGLSYMVSYSFSKQIGEFSNSIWATPTPFSPAGYERGRDGNDRTHILAINAIWEIPVGRGRQYGADMNPVLNAIVGGWQITGIYNFVSGSPLSFGVPGATLGNGFGTRGDQIGDPKLSNQSSAAWFNADAFAAPPDFTFGNSGIGLMDGPGDHVLDISFIKNFFITEEKYVQFRWEMFNMPNHVNLNNPNTTLFQGSTGQIGGSGPARRMQIGLKFIF